MPTASPPNPAGLEQIEAQKRAVARREKEKLAAVEAVTEAKRQEDAALNARAAEEKAKAELLPKVKERRGELLKAVDQGRSAITKRKEEIAKAEAAIGNLEGAVITAGDLARHDPLRALDTLNRAKAAYDKTLRDSTIRNP